MAYRTILTDYGLSRLAAATAAGVPITLVEMAVGDGGGNAVEPTQGQTSLVRETFRGTVNRVFQADGQTNKFIAELVIPAAVGGFTVREMGVYDETGGLFAVANTPATYKPTASEGAFADAVVRAAFIATNASVVTLQVDPNVAVATHQWVINNITAASLIPGGTTGQILAKESNADGDYVWKDPTDANVVVDVIEDRQTLADGQTVVNWSTVTNRGLAVYIEGVRIARGPGEDEWQENPANPATSIVLGKAYPDGAHILGTQNEPSGSVPFPLIRDENLADVPNKSLARNNLDVFSKSETRQMAPAGLVSFFARDTAPGGWLKCNGAAVSRTAYADLFAAIGTRFGAGDGFNTFNLPDLRGEFPRGWDDGRGVDAGRALGSRQSDQNRQHNHTGTANYAGDHSHGIRGSSTQIAIGGSSWVDGHQADRTISQTDQAGGHTHTLTIANEGGSEARPRNVALLACIKF